MRLPLILILFVLLAAFASAAPGAERKPVPVAIPIPAADSPKPDQLPTPPVSCTLGVSGPRSFVIDYLQPPDDAYFVAIDPTLCGGCSTAPGMWISSVKIALEFRVPCSLPVEVAVVAPVADTACAPPRPPITIGGPWPGTVSSSTVGIKDFTLTLGHPCAVTRRAYLQVRFTGTNPACTADGTRPRLVTTSSCSPCVAWNYYPADTADMCALLLPGTPVIWATVDSCVSASRVGVPQSPAGEHPLRVSPNPARDGSDISFTLATRAHVQVALHDVSGRRVRDVLDAPLAAGEHSLHWDGRDSRGLLVPAGTYFVVVRADEHMSARRVVFVR